MSLNTYRIPHLSGGAPKNVVIFLHGLGDSGSGGLLEIGRIWQRVLQDTEFLCPDAPFAFDMAPPDFGGRQWFSLQEFTPQAIDQGVRAAASILNEFMDEVLAVHKLQPSQLALVGFSQGTMMALHVALRRPEPVAAVIGYSGRLTNVANLKTEKQSAPPVLLVHGMLDEVLPFSSMAEAEKGLRDCGVPVRTLACPHLAHSIDESGIEAGMMFLQQHLS